MISSFVRALVSRGPRIEARATAAQRASTFWSRCGSGLDPGFRSGAWHPVAGRCFPCAYGETRIADIASDPVLCQNSALSK